MSIGPLRALIRKDINVYLHDRRAVVISFALPAVLSLFFGFAFGGAARRAQKPPRVDILVVDQDGSDGSRRFVAALTADASLGVTTAALDDARAKVRDGDVSVALVLPAGFADRTQKALAGDGAPADVTFLYDPSQPFKVAMAKGTIHGLVLRTFVIPDLLAKCRGLATPFSAKDEAVTGGEQTYDGAAHAVGGMAVQFILMSAIEAGVVILTDRQRGLWKRLMAAPLARSTLLLSKFLSGAILALMSMTFLYVFARFAMGVRIHGSFAGFALVAAAFALMASTLGVLVSTLGKTPQATRSFGIFVILIAVMLGGAWFPTFLFPAWLVPITAVVPTRWAVDGLDAMTWRGLGLADAIQPVACLLGAAIVFGALAMWRFRWEE